MNEPTRDPRILQLLEVCRCDRTEHADPLRAELDAAVEDNPELLGLWQRIQQIDDRLAKALQDAPMPEGLAGRILQRLATIPASLAAPAGSETAPSQRPAAWECSPDRRRRNLLAAVGCTLLAVAASLFVAVWLTTPTPQPVLAEQVLQLAIARFNYEQDVAERLHARPLDTAPAEYPPSTFVVHAGQVGWRELALPDPSAPQFEGAGVAYDFLDGNQPRATLYVLRAEVANLPDIPPALPSLSTGLCSAGIWQETGLVYVLVVRGGPEDYRQLIQMRPRPIA